MINTTAGPLFWPQHFQHYTAAANDDRCDSISAVRKTVDSGEHECSRSQCYFPGKTQTECSALNSALSQSDRDAGWNYEFNSEANAGQGICRLTKSGWSMYQHSWKPSAKPGGGETAFTGQDFKDYEAKCVAKQGTWYFGRDFEQGYKDTEVRSW